MNYGLPNATCEKLDSINNFYGSENKTQRCLNENESAVLGI